MKKNIPIMNTIPLYRPKVTGKAKNCRQIYRETVRKMVKIFDMGIGPGTSCLSKEHS